MPDKKLTDSEIKKALEDCLPNNAVICRKVNLGGEFNAEIESISNITIADIVGVINRLQAEIEELTAFANQLEDQRNMWMEKAEEQHIEIECLKTLKIPDDLKTEVERLTIENKEQKQKLDKLLPFESLLINKFYSPLAKEIKAEAYKEFAGNLEKAFQKTENQMPNSEVIKQTVQICRNAIRIVSKELVGEDK